MNTAVARRLVIITCMLAILALAPLAASQGPAAPAQSGEEVVDIVYFGKKKPILLRLHYSIDGKTLRGLRDEYIEKWFRYLDVDEDGMISADELRRAPDGKTMSEVMTQGGFLLVRFGAMAAPSFYQIHTGEVGDKISLAEFKAYYAGFYPRLGVYSHMTIVGMAEEASNRLFKALDANNDGKLALAELERLGGLMRRLDTNDDEFLTAQELEDAEEGAVMQRFPIDQHHGYTGQIGSFFHAHPSNNKNLPALLLAHYARGGSKTVDRSGIGLDEAAFDKLDVNRDGTLDVAELARWHERPADLEFTLRLGKEPSIAVRKTWGRLPACRCEGQGRPEAYPTGKDSPAVSQHSRRVCHLAAEDAVFHLVNADDLSPGFRFFNLRRILFEFFEEQDGKKKGFVTRDAFKGTFVNDRAFQFIDRNGDNKVTYQELQTFFEMADPGDASVVSLSFANLGKGLFQFLDADSDGRLSQMELLQGKARLAALDVGKTGFVPLQDLPTQHRITIHRLKQFDPVFAVQPLPFDLAGSAKLPDWFRKMDRNGDGHVSFAEFLGSRAEFDRIDTNRDGLISPEEAILRHAVVRKKN